LPVKVLLARALGGSAPLRGSSPAPIRRSGRPPRSPLPAGP
jgi:hypothetical protein